MGIPADAVNDRVQYDPRLAESQQSRAVQNRFIAEKLGRLGSSTAQLALQYLPQDSAEAALFREALRFAKEYEQSPATATQKSASRFGSTTLPCGYRSIWPCNY